MKIKDIKELVVAVNQGLGKDFCNVFQNQRKVLSGKEKIAQRDGLFTYRAKDNRDWAINKGGGTEVQYHISFNKKEKSVSYGLGFNAQYVPFANGIEPQDFIKPFTTSFINHKAQIDSILPDYKHLVDDDEFMAEPYRGGYALFGKKIKVKKVGTQFEINDKEYIQLIDDLKKQIEVYILIFNARNNIINMSKSTHEIIRVFDDKKQIILQGPPGTGKTYTAKDVAEMLIHNEVSPDKSNQKDRLESNEQFKLVQFHPSYTYEDFVRGIEANGTETGLEYRTVEKVLSKFARKAYENWENYHSNPEELYRKEWIQNKLDTYIENFSAKYATSLDGKIPLTEMVYVSQVDEDCFRYMGDTWAKSSRLNFADLTRLIELNLESPDDIKIPQTISKHAYHRSSYYGAILKDFFESTEAYTPSESAGIELHNYVLIIDEINRANLPSVLGELIYALEYRGESIDSMYEINGSSKILLPKNLFIIGTMNTADRSVGHIDYAIRRRFAFIDILPDEAPISTSEGKALFKKVESIFVKVEGQGKLPSDYLSPDFKYKDVQIGHSYFICEVDKLSFRLEYEIKPILREYLKDGILLPAAEGIIESLSI